MAHGSSQARGWIRAAAAGLQYSHSNTGSKLHLQPAPQFMAALDLNPLSEARDGTHILMDTSWIHFRCTTGTPYKLYFYEISQEHMEFFLEAESVFAKEKFRLI